MDGESSLTTSRDDGVILHVITGLENGGAEGVLYRLVTSDKNNAHEVVSLTGMDYYGDKLCAAGIRVTALGMPRGRLTLAPLLRLHRVIVQRKPALVQTWMYHADLLGGITARLARCPVVWSIRASDLPSQAHARRLSAIVHVASRLSRVVPRRVVYNSHSGAEAHERRGYSAKKTLVIPNGFDTEILAPSAAKRETMRGALGLSRETPLIGMVARWDPVKDHENLLSALATLRSGNPRWSCVLVGPGMVTDNDDLVALVTKHGLSAHIQLLGPRPDISTTMNGIDLHVLSSRSEGFPNVIAEAMACGTPCVTTNVGDAASIVGDTGWVVPSSNSTALASALSAALLEQAGVRWAARQRASRSRIVEHYGMSRMLRQYDQLWESFRGDRDRRHHSPGASFFTTPV